MGLFDGLLGVLNPKRLADAYLSRKEAEIRAALPGTMVQEVRSVHTFRWRGVRLAVDLRFRKVKDQGAPEPPTPTP